MFAAASAVLRVGDPIAARASPPAGDWQYAPFTPSAVYGTWKAFTETITRTTATPTMSLTADADPTANNWNLDTGSDAPPPGLTNEGYGADLSPPRGAIILGDG